VRRRRTTGKQQVEHWSLREGVQNKGQKPGRPVQGEVALPESTHSQKQHVEQIKDPEQGVARRKAGEESSRLKEKREEGQIGESQEGQPRGEDDIGERAYSQSSRGLTVVGNNRAPKSNTGSGVFKRGPRGTYRPVWQRSGGRPINEHEAGRHGSMGGTGSGKRRE